MSVRQFLVILALLVGLILPAGAIQAQDPPPQTIDVPTAVEAGPGDLDPTFAGFAGNGKMTSPIEIWATALQTDEKIVVAGEKDNTFALARYNPDGTLDTTFGTGGVVVTPILSTQTEARANAVAIQPNGKIVAAGGVKGSNDSNFAVVRYNANGSLDISFSGNGKTAPDFDDGDDWAYAVAIQADGRIVVAGEVWDVESGAPDDSDFGVLRFNPDGSPDSANFGSNGWVNIGFGDNDGARAIALQPDGKIVVAGYREQSCIDLCPPAPSGPCWTAGENDFDFALVRLNTDGSYDSSFSGDGKVTTGFDEWEGACAVALQSNGKIVAAGTQSHDAFALARYLPDGSLDTTFDGDGKLITPLSGDHSFATQVISQPDGKVVAAGMGSNQFALARYKTDGSLDTTFGGDGKVFTDFLPVEDEFVSALALQPDGLLIAAGVDTNFDADSGYLSRYFPDGSLDAGGRQMTAFGLPIADEEANAMLVQPDGKIVTAGYIAESTDQFALARHNPDGSLDPSFGQNGRVVYGLSGEERAYAVERLDDGSLVAAGRVSSGSQGDNFMIARFAEDGAFECFNITNFEGGNDRPYGVAIQPDQKIVVAGDVWSASSGRYEMGIARYQTNCSIDTSFGSNGKTQIGFSGDDTLARAVVVRPDGIIVVAGAHNDNVRLVFLTAQGGYGGSRVTDLGGVESASALVRQPDGKLLAAGWKNTAGSYDFMLVRYNAAGSLDTGFGLGGHQITDLGGFDIANTVAVREDGTIVAAGCSLSNNVERMALVQYDEQGQPDPAFNNGKPALTSFGGSSSCAQGVAFTGSRRIVAGGSAQTGNNRNFAIARYLTTIQETGSFSVYLPAVLK
jgi:uncharacterized delta-60 repeat protein